MARESMVVRLLQSAEDLLEKRPASSAYRRRSVSSAYYSVFHALAAVCVMSLVPKPRTDDELLRVYRALDHGQLRTALSQPPLKDLAQFKEVGLIFVKLQQERHRADYLPPDAKLFPVEEVRTLLQQARLALDMLNELTEQDKRMLATLLLFKERK
jgi:hypothetical protein